MLEKLTTLEIRILGSLIEKQHTTPDYYPMTLNGLVNACNQKTARYPVTEYEQDEVAQGLDTLREKKWVLRVDCAGARVAKYRHQVEAVVELEKPQLAILCLLLLRGPQTLGEIRTRCERLYMFPDIRSVDETMCTLIHFQEPCSLATELPREPGRKESRFTHLLGLETQTNASADQDNTSISTTPSKTARPLDSQATALLEELKSDSLALRKEMEILKNEFAELKKRFD